MKNEYPEDEFDRLDNRAKIGAHRSNRPHVATWKALLAGIIAVVVIVGAGFIYLQLVRGSNSFTESSASASASAGAVDKTTAVTILAVQNASSSAAAAETVLSKDGWKQLSSATAEGTEIPAKTSVVVSDKSLLAAGQAVASALGSSQASVSSDSPRPITVVLGKDFNPSASAVTPSSATPSSTAPATKSATASSSASPSASKNTVDKSTRVTVLNGTSRQGLAAKRAATLRADGWTVGSVTNAQSKSSRSSVHYRKASARASAQAVAKKFGIETVLLDNSYSAPITVILGTDQL